MPTATVPTTTMFGAPTATIPTTTMFGAPTTTTMFGVPTTIPTTTMFGGTTTIPTSTMFGAPTTTSPSHVPVPTITNPTAATERAPIPPFKLGLYPTSVKSVPIDENDDIGPIGKRSSRVTDEMEGVPSPKKIRIEFGLPTGEKDEMSLGDEDSIDEGLNETVSLIQYRAKLLRRKKALLKMLKVVDERLSETLAMLKLRQQE
eukprot:CAMPEP_0202955600 /NCGR_PEP_ID=MMETSP1396-20130829/133_1 /ASSEMBLY_ACC=CAM_ASM_000872 /TAXON_ID= /ORGANISM="Pseudokeronopsis sp., Strain Brazil" /LENGTH=202 /DNA_ID=CAMNT_0049672249 /DNA_START=548 /DNA_END=1156 /DNA_ORIENTATION=-